MVGVRGHDENTVTAAVLAQIEHTPDPRLRQIVSSLVKHLHDFAREVYLTEDEWFAAIEFLAETGHMCSGTRQEFILLSDTLGLSQLVVSQNHRRVPEATEQTVLGPFHVEGIDIVPNGADIAAGLPGDPCYVNAWVTSVSGEPIPRATVDVWQADGVGGYDVQDPSWAPDEAKLRAVFETDTAGHFHFRTILPSAYPIPTDGPVGRMLMATNRTAMRPAHIHFLVRAPNYDTLITHIFVEGDPWLDKDAVFGVRGSCIAPYVRHDRGDVTPDGTVSAGPFYTLDYTFRLQSL